MSLRKKSLARHLQSELSGFAHHADGGTSATVQAPVIPATPQRGGVYSKGVNAALMGENYAAQFDLTARVVYSKCTYGGENLSAFTQKEGYDLFKGGFVSTKNTALTEIDFNALPSNLKTELPVYLFGNADFASGFKTISGIMNNAPLWRRAEPYIAKQIGAFIGVNLNPTSGGGEVFNVPSIALANGKAQTGDLIIPFVFSSITTIQLPNGESNEVFDVYIAEVVLTCKQVSYGTLLDAINSDRFIIDRIRYRVQEGQSAQFENQIYLVKQSLFGKTSNDFVSPTSFVRPEQFQSNIVDIPLEKGIDKESIMGVYLNPNVGEIVLSMFVPVKNSLTQNL